MPKRWHSTEEIIGKLREVEVLVGQDGSLGHAIVVTASLSYLPSAPGKSA